MKKYVLLLFFTGISSLVFSQFKIDSLGVADTINFNDFTGIGLNQTPLPGELNSANWRITGFSDGNTQFGGVYNTGDFARGSSTGGETIGGAYAFNNSQSGTLLGFQPTASDFNPGRLTFKVQNNTSQIIKNLIINYDFWFLNNEDRASSFNLFYSADDTTYYQDTTVKATTLETSDTLGWNSYSKICTLKNINIAVGDIFYIQWRSADVSGAGSRDEFGIDNLIINTEAFGGSPSAELQLIHNSADASLNALDIYFDGVLEYNDLGFRTATRYKLVDADDSVRVHIAPSNSVDTNSAYWKGTMFLNDGQEYVGIINGLVGTGYSPSSTARPLDFYLHAGRKMSAFFGNTDILLFNGSTDLGPIDALETSIPAGTVMDNVDYADFAGYEEYLTDDYSIDIMDSTSSNVLYSLQLDLAARNLLDSAIVVVTSGFHDPTVNNNGASFDIMYAPVQGGSLISLMANITSLTEIAETTAFRIYPNPAKDFLNVESKSANAELRIFTMDGRVVFSKKMDGKKENINLSTLPKGIFLLKLTSEKENWSKVFVRR